MKQILLLDSEALDRRYEETLRSVPSSGFWYPARWLLPVGYDRLHGSTARQTLPQPQHGCDGY